VVAVDVADEVTVDVIVDVAVATQLSHKSGQAFLIASMESQRSVSYVEHSPGSGFPLHSAIVVVVADEVAVEVAEEAAVAVPVDVADDVPEEVAEDVMVEVAVVVTVVVVSGQELHITGHRFCASSCTAWIELVQRSSFVHSSGSSLLQHRSTVVTVDVAEEVAVEDTVDVTVVSLHSTLFSRYVSLSSPASTNSAPPSAYKKHSISFSIFLLMVKPSHDTASFAVSVHRAAHSSTLATGVSKSSCARYFLRGPFFFPSGPKNTV